MDGLQHIVHFLSREFENKIFIPEILVDILNRYT